MPAFKHQPIVVVFFFLVPFKWLAAPLFLVQRLSILFCCCSCCLINPVLFFLFLVSSLFFLCFLLPLFSGVILRDSRGIAQVKSITNSKVLRILKAAGLAPELPEDLYCLIKKAVSVRKHLDKFRQDKDAKFRLILIESRIHRTSRYYKSVKALPPNWKYESATASTLVS